MKQLAVKLKDTFLHKLFLSFINKFKKMLLVPWSSGQSSWLQIQRSGFDSQRYQIFWEIAGLERGPLGLLSIIEDLLGRKK
jgi:hypothetical protein